MLPNRIFAVRCFFCLVVENDIRTNWCCVLRERHQKRGVVIVVISRSRFIAGTREYVGRGCTPTKRESIQLSAIVIIGRGE